MRFWGVKIEIEYIWAFIVITHNEIISNEPYILFCHENTSFYEFIFHFMFL